MEKLDYGSDVQMIPTIYLQATNTQKHCQPRPLVILHNLLKDNKHNSNHKSQVEQMLLRGMQNLLRSTTANWEETVGDQSNNLNFNSISSQILAKNSLNEQQVNVVIERNSLIGQSETY